MTCVGSLLPVVLVVKLSEKFHTDVTWEECWNWPFFFLPIWPPREWLFFCRRSAINCMNPHWQMEGLSWDSIFKHVMIGSMSSWWFSEIPRIHTVFPGFSDPSYKNQWLCCAIIGGHQGDHEVHGSFVQPRTCILAYHRFRTWQTYMGLLMKF